MINWPDALVRELAERRCMVFLGAGASAGCVAATDKNRKPPTWESLLRTLLSKMTDDSQKSIADDLIGEKKLLEAAEIICANVAKPDFSQFIRDTFVAPRFQHSLIHEAVLSIDPKVTLTTNYDDIYDAYCRSGDATDGYNVVKYYDSHLVSDLRSPVRLIVKVHGCVSNPGQIVLTRSQYFEQRRNHSNFFRILDALFLSSSLLFIGYSLSDPDIQLILENASIAAPMSHPHYAVVSDDVHPALKLSWSKAYNIHFLDFPAGEYQVLNDSLNELAADVEAFRATHLT
jgi:SIR2-like domain